ncbi:lysophospholipid acyltransferase family protein [Yoonia sp. 208BN28-4]|uniref:lysophospholipid acyltransferase family protein n=1 Tax=Yoonia sp. 208BN28-4 TaxID=3126505 RepID=UPI0030AF0DF2
MPSTLRRRIEKSAFLARAIATLFGWYLRLCIATSRWEVAGLEALKADLANGPVLCVLWHGRLMMIAPHWPKDAGNLSCLHDTAPVGRIAGALQAYFGLQPIEMSARRSNVAASRAVMKRAKEGVSIGITADGPQGPGYIVKDASLEWARIMQRPVYGYAFATRRHRKLKTWDAMMMPCPFTKGATAFAPIKLDLPRKADAAQIETARGQLQAGLEAVTAQADSMVQTSD